MNKSKSSPINLLSFDFYRKLPTDFVEASKTGGSLSLVAMVVMILLIFLESSAFFSQGVYVSNVILDTTGTSPTTAVNKALPSKIQINFNITMMDMDCSFVTIDVLDVIGTRSIDVTQNVEKWAMTAEGVRVGYKGRNSNPIDIIHDHDLSTGENKHGSLASLHEDGEHALPLNRGTFAEAVEQYDFVFVDFYAPWCIWCQRLAPTWEKFAEEIEGFKNPTDGSKPTFQDAVITKVDCTEDPDFCGVQGIAAFPTLRLFFNGEKHLGDFKGDRTLEGLRHYLFSSFESQGYEKDHEAKIGHFEEMKVISKTIGKEWNAIDHPGCMIVGSVHVNRVPGNFHIEARSSYQNLNPKLTNVSHIVNHLSFGETPHKGLTYKMKKVPEEFRMLSPMDGNVYAHDKLHAAYHHVLKVVPTQYIPPIGGMINMYMDLVKKFAYKFSIKRRENKALNFNQLLSQSQLVFYEMDEVPEAKFTYDLSPLIVKVQQKGMRWYDFLTKLLAILGGTFTVFGLFDRGVSRFKRKIM